MFPHIAAKLPKIVGSKDKPRVSKNSKVRVDLFSVFFGQWLER
jgi:hypothetical protein